MKIRDAGLRNRAVHTALRAGLPEDALGLGVRVMLLGRAAVQIEGPGDILELGETYIRLRTPDGILRIEGRALRLRALTIELTIIEGERVDSISYGVSDGGKREESTHADTH